MSKILFVLRPTEDLKTIITKVIERFELTQQITLQLKTAKNINDIANDIESGNVAIFFNETELQVAEINLLAELYEDSSNPPFLIVDDTNYDLIDNTEVLAKNPIPTKFIGKASGEFTESFLFNCVRNLLTPPGQKLDIRYIKSIVHSVCDVIEQNTQCKMEPQPIVEAKAKEVPEQISMVSALYGDGFLGSITIGTERSLLVTFAQKMLYCEESDVDDEMVSDLAAEIANQILGAVRNSLNEFGWKLKASMQVVTVGDEFLNASTSNGRYYHIPFSYEGVKFFLSLCYNTYQTSIREIEEEQSGNSSNVMDIRLASAFDSSARKILKANLNEDIELATHKKHSNKIYTEDSLHLFHAAGWQGGVIIGLEVPRLLSNYIMKNTMGMAPEDVDNTMINDYWGEIINQIGGDFLKTAKTNGYTLQRVYQGEFSGRDLDFVIKTPGYYFRRSAKIGDSHLEVFFGVDSNFGHSFYDLWPYLNARKDFIAEA